MVVEAYLWAWASVLYEDFVYAENVFFWGLRIFPKLVILRIMKRQEAKSS